MLEDLAKIMPIVQTVGIPLLGYGAYLLRNIRDEFRVLNGRMTRVEQWREDHGEESARRGEAVDREFDRLHGQIDSIYQQKGRTL